MTMTRIMDIYMNLMIPLSYVTDIKTGRDKSPTQQINKLSKEEKLKAR